MTSNQLRAADLARALCAGRVSVADLTDRDWNLLLLAADLNNVCAVPAVVCRRVLERVGQGTGYFAPVRVRPVVAAG